MDKNYFLENVKQQFINPNEIELNFNSNFREIDTYDSLTGMTILVMLKDIFDVDISEAEFKSKITVEDLFEYVLHNIKS